MAPISIGIGNRPLEGLSVGQTFKDMDSAWYIVTAAVAARGQKKKGRPKERLDTAASHKAFRGKKRLKAKGSGWI